MKRPFIKFATVIVLLSSVCLRADEPDKTRGLQTMVSPFVDQHCLRCHGADSAEGVVRLDNLPATVSTADDKSRWLRVLQKLESGEMPPAREPRPSPAEIKRVTGWIEQNLVAVNQEKQSIDGRVVLRRLNRGEYENTVNDLFAITADVKDLLPEDNRAHGFDNIGEALNISSVLLERYLETADVVLDHAIKTGPRPETFTQRYSYKDERRVKNHKSYKRVDDAVVFFSSGYSPTEINQFRSPSLGEYRIRISAYAHQTEESVTLRVYGAVGVKKHLAGYFDVGPEPTVVELKTRLGERNTIRIVPYGTRLSKWNEALNEKGPGLAVQWVEIEGPLTDQWPPRSQRLLFGDLPIEVVNADAIKSNRRLKPVLEVVSRSPVSDARNILERLLPKMFRRPVGDSQIEPYLAIIQSHLDAGYTFQNAVRVGLKAALCSPDFLYLIGISATDGGVTSPSSRDPESDRQSTLDDFELASRLSYFLWNTLPDDELLGLAASGQIGNPNTLRQQTERMLNDPRAARFRDDFVDQWLGLRDIDFTSPDAILYPEFDELLKVSMVEETRLFFNELLEHDLSLLNIVDSDFTILNQRLARHYGIEGVKGQTFRKVRLPDGVHRGGVLTQASVLKVTANGTNTSPVIRGVWVLDNILGQPVPPPPANVAAVEPDIRGATSIRQQLSKHRESGSCASCHSRIDPAGFALENFDVIGGWRQYYRSIGEGQRLTLEVSGRRVRYRLGRRVRAGDAWPSGKKFKDVDEFKQLLLEDKDQIARCVTEKLMTYATGGGIQTADRTEIDEIVRRIAADGFGLRSLVHEVVQSRIFHSK